MKIKINTYSFHLASDVWEPMLGQPRDIYWILEKARALGADGIDISDMRHFRNGITVASLKERLQGMLLSFGTGGCDPAHLREMVSICSQTGERVFRTFLGKGVTNEKIERLKSVMPQAEHADVRIAIENHQDLTSDELLAVIEAVGSPYLGVCLDTGNALGVLDTPLAVAERLAPVTFTTHIKEYAVMPQDEGYVFWSVPTGRGSCSVKEQMEILFEKSPWKEEIPLNVEAPIELVDKSSCAGKDIVGGLACGGHMTNLTPPDFGGWTPEIALLEEEKLVRESLQNVRQMFP